MVCISDTGARFSACVLHITSPMAKYFYLSIRKYTKEREIQQIGAEQEILIRKSRLRFTDEKEGRAQEE